MSALASLCPICNLRKSRRFCPGTNQTICTMCCGEEREQSIACPLDCKFLREAHDREKPHEAHPGEEVPNVSVQVTDRFLDEHAAQADALGRIVLIAALRAEGALDRDVREALDAVIRTQKTLQSGVYYQTRPQNRVAAAVADLIQEGWAEYQKAENEKLGFQATHSSELIQLLVFLERVAFDRDNRRPKGRAFIDYLNRFFQKTSELDVPLAEDRLLIVP